jgi:hypothetical protein
MVYGHAERDIMRRTPAAINSAVSQLVLPHVPIEKNAVHEPRHRPAAAFHVADRS